MKRTLLIGIAIVISVLCLVVAFQTYIITHPSMRHAITESPEDYNLKYENITFKNDEGNLLKGWLIPAEEANGTVIVAHGYGASREGMLRYALFLHKARYTVLLFDFRDSGESEGSYSSMGYYEKNDIKAAVEYLRAQRIDTENLYGLGISMGGAALVLAEAEEHTFKALVLDSVYPSLHQTAARRVKHSFGLPKFPFATASTLSVGVSVGANGFEVAPEKYIQKVNVPVLIIQGTQDPTIKVEDAQRLYEKANEPKKLWLVEGAGHVAAYRIEQEAYEEKVLKLFENR